MDLPGRGRSAYVPSLDGGLNPPRSGPLMEEVWSSGRPPQTPQSNWPQAGKHTQWPGDGPNKGKMGDPIFDYFAKTDTQSPTGKDMEQLTADDIVELVDLIHSPVVLLLHSGVAMTYDPPIKEPAELEPVRQEKADAPDLIPCWIQKEPAHKLVHLESIPVLNVSGEASYHRPYAHCTAKWLNQAGVKTTYVNLEDVGIHGNGHQFMSEKNSAEISKFFMDWLEKNVP
jgi:hypothetical protein